MKPRQSGSDFGQKATFQSTCEFAFYELIKG